MFDFTSIGIISLFILKTKSTTLLLYQKTKNAAFAAFYFFIFVLVQLLNIFLVPRLQNE
jgi:hypothetical protein